MKHRRPPRRRSVTQTQNMKFAGALSGMVVGAGVMVYAYSPLAAPAALSHSMPALVTPPVAANPLAVLSQGMAAPVVTVMPGALQQSAVHDLRFRLESLIRGVDQHDDYRQTTGNTDTPRDHSKDVADHSEDSGRDHDKDQDWDHAHPAPHPHDNDGDSSDGAHSQDGHRVDVWHLIEQHRDHNTGDHSDHGTQGDRQGTDHSDHSDRADHQQGDSGSHGDSGRGDSAHEDSSHGDSGRGDSAHEDSSHGDSGHSGGDHSGGDSHDSNQGSSDQPSTK